VFFYGDTDKKYLTLSFLSKKRKKLSKKLALNQKFYYI